MVEGCDSKVFRIASCQAGGLPQGELASRVYQPRFGHAGKAKGRWAVYGISRLRKKERATAEEVKIFLVVLDPRYRYE